MTARTFVLVPAAGGGARFGGALPKQYALLAGVPVLARTLERLATALAPAATFVAVAADDLHFERMAGRPPDAVALRCGGATRAVTVRNALATIADRCADDDWIVVHDAARPCVPHDALARLTEHLRDEPVGGLLAVPVADTVKRSDGDADAPRVAATVPRNGLWQAQTPQMFRYGVLRRAFAAEAADACTDEAQAVEALGLAPRLVRGSPANLKITFPEDIALAAAILAAQAAEGRP
ncbi:MAG: 2-C-methyl-D-erythritol 4-phosphate cytidylyltransferase [Betaproteobacteria bacterium]|nr:2-C-methyl-D-erythritol 4-phosphate cytidylyltransferase [Betaproteobacteria bacterium]